jgi:5-formyltetrahydrofolate cyclo-ligase
VTPEPTIADAKVALRRRLREQLRRVSAAEWLAAREGAGALLARQPVWREAGCILFFAPLAEEIDLWPLLESALRSGRRVALPRYRPSADGYEAALLVNPATQIVRGRFGIREPKADCPALPLNQLDLALVPGVGFDCRGRRLGRGRGFYDRILAAVVGVRCGVALDSQVLPVIPQEAHDQALDCIVTPTRWVACSRRVAEK